MANTTFGRSVKISCLVCGRDVIGVVDANGVVHPSDGNRSALDTQTGICTSCAERRKNYKPLADPHGLDWDS
jgi:hypothetical protein